MEAQDYIPCQACDAKTRAHCVACDGRGHLPLHRCPNAVLPNDVWRAVQYFVLADDGHLPVAAGVAHQSAQFLEGWRVWRQERARIRAERQEEATRNANSKSKS